MIQGKDEPVQPQHLLPVPKAQAITLVEQFGEKVDIGPHKNYRPGRKGFQLFAVVCTRERKSVTPVNHTERFFELVNGDVYQEVSFFLVPEDKVELCLSEDKIWFTEIQPKQKK